MTPNPGHTPAPSIRAVADSLASAFLDAARVPLDPGSGGEVLGHGAAAREHGWNRPVLIAAGASVLGARRRWLSPLVRAVLDAYPRAPFDRPRELAAWIEASAVLGDACAAATARGQHLVLVRHAVYEPVGAASPLPATPAELAGLLGLDIGELAWFADQRGWNRRAGSARLQHYRYEWRARPGRVPRLLEVPGQRLMRLQRQLVHEVLTALPIHPAAHGFVPGRSARTGAAVHAGSHVVIGMDLTTFFARVGRSEITAALRRAGWGEAVAPVLAALATHAVPEAVIRAMPPGGNPEERFALAQALRLPHLPQGAPTSPMLANLAMRRLDDRLLGWAAAVGARYTRYADDLTFSGDQRLAARSDAFIRGVSGIVADCGQRVNERKTRVRPRGTSQRVTGIVVNAHPAVDRRSYDALRAPLHNCARTGPAAQNRENLPYFREHLRGRIDWVVSLTPKREPALRRLWEAIEWEEPGSAPLR
ncbi:RNA-directed DNA polymerase [Mycetocola tolaasinivorans]|uniref:RNA-directed DNA polymerase n=1 Tax=Mycetocola tolaasinivorans TaxID=76635 RepID=A0A3L7A3A5_9MICO|nr:reverse transcriptase family protein [Mycetocola tolaasinivorans]RLP74739.1 RNA-directed DNA polymerase [Mycetocola tolaasinivorans]